MEPNGWIIFFILVGWCLLFWGVFSLGSYIIEKNRNSARKKWGVEECDYNYKKWIFRLYTIAFFVGIPLLVVIALLQEI